MLKKIQKHFSIQNFFKLLHLELHHTPMKNLKIILTQSIFIGPNSRDAINKRLSDYTPIFLYHVTDLIYRNLLPIDVALIQVLMPNTYGFVSLGINVDIVKSAVEKVKLVIAQINSYMPRVEGETFTNIKDIDYIVH